jgi:glycosyltransferase involved in cell wall biosynthesis
VPGRPARAQRVAARAALDLPADVFVCLLMGRISPWKGQDVLVRALSEPGLRERDAIALIAGAAWPGEERHERALRELASELGVADRVRLVGFRSDTENLRGAADVVTVPSSRPDPLPNSALEAAAAGCCVVAAATGGLPEIITDGATGRLVAAGSPEALAGTLAELAEDSAQRERLGRAAEAEIPRRFSTERLLDSTQELYDGLLARE